mmetsp:Transcript_6835/g.9269  ORF Transcript_6835/g.9269 Transcript_6835/m.9269 type:complete len:105 (-) Transcript_6835:51-365(-)
MGNDSGMCLIISDESLIAEAEYFGLEGMKEMLQNELDEVIREKNTAAESCPLNAKIIQNMTSSLLSQLKDQPLAQYRSTSKHDTLLEIQTEAHNPFVFRIDLDF